MFTFSCLIVVFLCAERAVAQSKLLFYFIGVLFEGFFLRAVGIFLFLEMS